MRHACPQVRKCQANGRWSGKAIANACSIVSGSAACTHDPSAVRVCTHGWSTVAYPRNLDGAHTIVFTVDVQHIYVLCWVALSHDNP